MAFPTYFHVSSFVFPAYTQGMVPVTVLKVSMIGFKKGQQTTESVSLPSAYCTGVEFQVKSDAHTSLSVEVIDYDSLIV